MAADRVDRINRIKIKYLLAQYSISFASICLFYTLVTLIRHLSRGLSFSFQSDLAALLISFSAACCPES